MSRAILVTGATGKQGGAVVNALVAAKADFSILAVTRDATSPSALRLKSKASNITVVQGNLDDTEAIFKAAEAATSVPIWGVFSIQAPGMSKDGPLNEQRQGQALVDSSIKHGVKHFVYSSVDRGGDERSPNNPTDVPHFASKHNIEKHLIAKANGTEMTWTILRPAAFMENITDKSIGSVFCSSWEKTKLRSLQLVSAEDIGVFAAKSFMDVEQFKNQALSLAGDDLTFDAMVQAFKEAKGTEPPRTWGLVVKGVFWFSKEMRTMFEFFANEGYGADIAKLKKIHPGLKDMKAFLKD